MRVFANCFHCRCGVHCETCRDREGGREWRLMLMRSYSVPGGAVDFECPHGRPWGYEPADDGRRSSVTMGQAAATGRRQGGCCGQAVEAARGAAKALGLATGISAPATWQEYRYRHAICEQCEEFGVHRRGFCGQPLVKTDRTCGCSIYIKAKLADEHCPQGKW